jgi:hypothetical protein
MPLQPPKTLNPESETLTGPPALLLQPPKTLTLNPEPETLTGPSALPLQPPQP